MYICSELLFRCRLGVCSPYLLSVGLHPVVFVAFTCGEVGLKPRASCILTLIGVSLQTTSRQSNSHNVPCERQTSPSLAPGAAAQSHRSRSPFRPRTKTHTSIKQFSSSRQSTRHRPNLCTSGKLKTTARAPSETTVCKRCAL